MVCPNCGHRHDVSWYCEKCGTRMINDVRIEREEEGPRVQVKAKTSLGVILLMSLLLLWTSGLTAFSALLFIKNKENQAGVSKALTSAPAAKLEQAEKDLKETKGDVSTLYKKMAMSDMQTTIESEARSSYFSVQNIVFDESKEKVTAFVYLDMALTKKSEYVGGREFKFSNLVLSKELTTLSSSILANYKNVQNSYKGKVTLLSLSDGDITYIFNDFTLGTYKDGAFTGAK